MTSFQRDYEEKRDFIRMKIEAPLATTITHNGTNIEALCRDISGGGLLLEVPEAFQIGDELKVVVASDHGHSPTLTANATVTRVQAQPDNLWMLGLQINELT